MIHIAFSLYDSKGIYTKYGAVALLSLLSNTASKLTVHIIHDDSLSEENRHKLKGIADRFHQEIVFYRVQLSNFSEVEHMAKSCTIGTFFRLKIPELVDRSISKIIYLDADLVINTDIKGIWENDIENYYVAACQDYGLIGRGMKMSDGLVPADLYYNAGVSMFNLRKIRQDFNLLDDSINFLKEHPNCEFADQDATNYLFMNSVLYLDLKYNMVTIKKRGLLLPLEDGIYHFAGDYCNPIDQEAFDGLFLHYLYLLNDEKWLTEYYLNYLKDSSKQLLVCQAFMERLIAGFKKKVYWGANSVCFKAVANIVKPVPEYDYIVDNNSNMHGTNVMGMVVYHPQKLFAEKRDECVIIVVAKEAYSAIKNNLEKKGLVENKDFFDGLLLLTQSCGKRMVTY